MLKTVITNDPTAIKPSSVLLTPNFFFFWATLAAYGTSWACYETRLTPVTMPDPLTARPPGNSDLNILNI